MIMEIRQVKQILILFRITQLLYRVRRHLIIVFVLTKKLYMMAHIGQLLRSVILVIPDSTVMHLFVPDDAAEYLYLDILARFVVIDDEALALVDCCVLLPSVVRVSGRVGLGVHCADYFDVLVHVRQIFD